MQCNQRRNPTWNFHWISSNCICYCHLNHRQFNCSLKTNQNCQIAKEGGNQVKYKIVLSEYRKSKLQLLNVCFDFGKFVYSPREGTVRILTANSSVGESHTLFQCYWLAGSSRY